MALLLDPGVYMLVVNHTVHCNRGCIPHQKLRLWSLTLGAGCELGKLCIALRDDLNQILFSAIVNCGILLESLLAWWFCKWLVMKKGRLLEHHLVWGANFNDFLAIRGNCLWIVKFEYSSVWYRLRRGRLSVDCCTCFKLVLFLSLSEP